MPLWLEMKGWPKNDFRVLLPKFFTVNPENDFLEPYTINKSEILEVWSYVRNIGFDEKEKVISD